jgi:hypothetical protein
MILCQTFLTKLEDFALEVVHLHLRASECALANLLHHQIRNLTMGLGRKVTINKVPSQLINIIKIKEKKMGAHI